ncbi:MAG TPA: hypothetical protein VF195_06680 [Actinomycetota bacterium]
MTVLGAPLAVGGPNLVSGEGWDVAPFVLVAALLILMRWARIPLHTPAVCAAIAVGVLLDTVIDASRMSFPVALAVLTLAFGIVALRRTPAR